MGLPCRPNAARFDIVSADATHQWCLAAVNLPNFASRQATCATGQRSVSSLHFATARSRCILRLEVRQLSTRNSVVSPHPTHHRRRTPALPPPHPQPWRRCWTTDRCGRPCGRTRTACQSSWSRWVLAQQRHRRWLIALACLPPCRPSAPTLPAAIAPCRMRASGSSRLSECCESCWRSG